jgi:hypothetical protein
MRRALFAQRRGALADVLAHEAEHFVGDEASNAGPAVLSQLLSAFLVHLIASCDPVASTPAMRSASPSTSSRGSDLLTRPIRSASCPVTISPVIR